MTNQEKMAKVMKWKNSARVPPLMCGKDSMHADLEPIEETGEVRLVCLINGCGYEQAIPPFVLTESPENLKDS